VTATFLGASVRNFSASLGWNEARGSLDVQLVVDPTNGDTPPPETPGLPVHFEFGSLHFGGILQKTQKLNDLQGLPLYQVICDDPKSILSNCELILGGYSGVVSSQTRNLINVFGFWESAGFNASQSNATGMPWSKVLVALNAIINQPAVGPYGGPLTLAGFNYSLDLSALPTPPAYYRIGGGTTANLLELIAQLCDDAGCDYYVTLIGFTIKVMVVPRINQPPLGTISAITSTNWGDSVVRSNSGVELRNETTSAFLIGGAVQALYQQGAIYSFWDYDAAGNPSIGVPGYKQFLDTRYTTTLRSAMSATQTTLAFTTLSAPVNDRWPTPTASSPIYAKVGNEIVKITAQTVVLIVERAQFGTTAASHPVGAAVTLCWGAMYGEFMTLNSSEIADITGSVNYQSSTAEMRFALNDRSSWESYVAKANPDLAATLKLFDPAKPVVAKRQALAPDIVNDAPERAKAIAASIVSGVREVNIQKVYEFVLKYARDHYGKKYAVTVPQVAYSQDAESLRIVTSHQVADGGYLEEGSNPLGLSLWNEDIFKNPDGTFQAFVRYDNLFQANVNVVSSESAIEPAAAPAALSRLYVRCNVDPNFIQVNGQSAVVITTEGLYDNPTSPIGSQEMVAAQSGQGLEKSLRLMNTVAFGSFMMRCFPAERRPNAAAIPLRSNVLTYGPWYAAGIPGKIRLHQDTSLVPWEYGGYTFMNQAGFAQVAQAITNTQVVETASLELVGMPTKSLGETLVDGGPNITRISVNYGTQGITTTFDFSTYTPRFGVFGKANTDKLRQMGRVSQDLRRALRAALKDAKNQRETIVRARTTKQLMGGAPPAILRQTPHDVLLSEAFYDEDTGKVRVGATTVTYGEAVAFSNANDDTRYKSTSIMSLAGVVRPFSMDRTKSLLLPDYPSEIDSQAYLTAASLDPWRGDNDIEILSWGETYGGLHRYPSSANIGLRPMGVRFPMVGVGWGYDTEGNPVPGVDDVFDRDGNPVSAETVDSEYGLTTDGFPSGYKQRQDWWKAGPVDVLYDRRRGTWTSHDVVTGSDPVGGSMDVDDPIGTYTLAVDSLEAGKTIALFDVNNSRWVALPAGAWLPLTAANYDSPDTTTVVADTSTIAADAEDGLLFEAGDPGVARLKQHPASSTDNGRLSTDRQFIGGLKTFEGGLYGSVMAFSPYWWDGEDLLAQAPDTGAEHFPNLGDFGAHTEIGQNTFISNGIVAIAEWGGGDGELWVGTPSSTGGEWYANASCLRPHDLALGTDAIIVSSPQVLDQSSFDLTSLGFKITNVSMLLSYGGGIKVASSSGIYELLLYGPGADEDDRRGWCHLGFNESVLSGGTGKSIDSFTLYGRNDGSTDFPDDGDDGPCFAVAISGGTPTIRRGRWGPIPGGGVVSGGVVSTLPTLGATLNLT